MSAPGWTTDEDNVLMSLYSRGGWRLCKPYLPGWTNKQIMDRAWRLGLRVANPATGAGNRRERPVPVVRMTAAERRLAEFLSAKVAA